MHDQHMHITYTILQFRCYLPVTAASYFHVGYHGYRSVFIVCTHTHTHSHRLALVSSQSSENPAHYLEPDDRILSVMSGASPSAMLVLCVNMPGQALLEIMDSIRQNVTV